jgi:hypothetical protein
MRSITSRYFSTTVTSRTSAFSSIG